MPNGRLKIGGDFLMIGTKYLRIGPGGRFVWLAEDIDELEEGLSSSSFTIEDDGVDRVVFLNIHTEGTAPVPNPIVTGDLTWTLVDAMDGDGVGIEDRVTLWWALLPAGGGPKTVDIDLVEFQVSYTSDVYGVSGLDTSSPVVQSMTLFSTTSGTHTLVWPSSFAEADNFGFVVETSAANSVSSNYTRVSNVDQYEKNTDGWYYQTELNPEFTVAGQVEVKLIAVELNTA